MTVIEQQLRDAIKADGRSQYAIATAAGISPIQLSRFLRGKQSLTLTTVGKLCQALGLELREAP